MNGVYLQYHTYVTRFTKPIQIASVLVCLVLDEQFTIVFSHVRSPSLVPPGRRKGLEDKTYPAMDLLVHGEFDGISCILVEDCIRMQWYVMFVLLSACSLLSLYKSIFAVTIL